MTESKSNDSTGTDVVIARIYDMLVGPVKGGVKGAVNDDTQIRILVRLFRVKSGIPLPGGKISCTKSFFVL